MSSGPGAEDAEHADNALAISTVVRGGQSFHLSSVGGAGDGAMVGGKKWRSRASLICSGVSAPAICGNLLGGQPTAVFLTCQIDLGVVSDSLAAQCAALLRLMAANYWCLTVLLVSLFAWVGFLLCSLSVAAKIFLREPITGVHQGFDFGDGLDHGTLAWRSALSLLR